MAHHDDLLDSALRTVDGRIAAPTEADLRRAVSTAYYALFHLLIDEATQRLVSVPVIRPRVARTFEHKLMRAVCADYKTLKPDAGGSYIGPSGDIVPKLLVEFATTFVSLHEARQIADYDLSRVVTYNSASAHVMSAGQAFQDWLLIQSDPAADAFLAELWCRGMPKR